MDLMFKHKVMRGHSLLKLSHFFVFYYFKILLLDLAYRYEKL